MTMKLEFKTDNASFESDKPAEISYILRKIAERVYDGETCGNINDSNGNHIGKWSVD